MAAGSASRWLLLAVLVSACGEHQVVVMWPDEANAAGSIVLGVRGSGQLVLSEGEPVALEPDDGAGEVELALYADDLMSLGLAPGFRRLAEAESGSPLPEPMDVFVLQDGMQWRRSDAVQSAIAFLRTPKTNRWCNFVAGPPLPLSLADNWVIASAQENLLMMTIDDRSIHRFELSDDGRSGAFVPLSALSDHLRGQLLAGGNGQLWTREAISSTVASVLFELAVEGDFPVETPRTVGPAGVHHVAEVDGTLWVVTEQSDVFRQTSGAGADWEAVGQASQGDPRFFVTSDGLYLKTETDVYFVQDELRLVYSSLQMITSAIAHPMGGLIVAESATGDTVRVTYVRRGQGEVVLELLPDLRGTAFMLAFEQGFLHEFYSTSGPQLQLRARRYGEAVDDCDFRVVSSVQAAAKGLFRWGERAVSIRQSQVTGDLFGVVIDQGS